MHLGQITKKSPYSSNQELHTLPVKSFVLLQRTKDDRGFILPISQIGKELKYFVKLKSNSTL